MKTRSMFLAIAVSLCVVPAARGQRTLSNSEIQKILQEVTSRPRKTWIPAGTIQATHQEYGAAKVTNPGTIVSEINKALQEYRSNPNKKEKTATLQKMAEDAIPFNVRYKLANEYAMSARQTVRYDGNRFYWEIEVSSRSDTVRPQDHGVANNYMTKHFNRSWNDRRIFAWDGQKYTTYSASANRATVDMAGRLPRAVNGPLTAGLIPWGHEEFSSANLAAAPVSARENAGGTTDVTLALSNGVSASLTLDSAARGYAVTKATLTYRDGSVTTYTCSDYRLVGSNWVPWKITIERRNRHLKSELPSSEQWTFTSVSTTVPSGGSFSVPLAAHAGVEYLSPVAASSALSVQSNAADTDELLAQHLAYAAAQGSRAQNCATAALQTVASGFGKSLAPNALTRLVGPDGYTNLYDLRQFAQSQGLYCKAVRTDLATLADLQGARAILHIPGKNHLVVLDQADDQDVWLTDLSSRRFHYRRSADVFPLEWSEGTALLLSNRPIAGSFTEVADARLRDTVGGMAWDCTMLLQEASVWYCDDDDGGCWGAVDVYWERWGCDWAPSGVCYNECMVGSQSTPCIFVGYCTVTGEWTYYYMEACE